MPRSRKAEMTNTPENGEVATMDQPEPGEQHDLFPELDLSDPKQKQLYREARKLDKLKGERESLLTTSKEKVDGQSEKVKALMHECNVLKFEHKGVKAEIIPAKEKLEVTVESEDDEDDDD